MKLCLLFAASLALVTGCAASRPKPAADVFAQMDAELAQAIGTTTVTSERFESRLKPAEWDEQEPKPVLRTWGVAPAPTPVDPGARP